MATTVILTGVVKAAAPSTTCYVNFSDGTQLEFPDLETLQQNARQPDTDVNLTRQICLAYLVARSPDLSNIASVANKNFIFDLSAPQPIKVQ